jgi:hypothetical protein
MNVAAHADLLEPGLCLRRTEPRWMTIADVGVFVAGVAVAMTIPTRSLNMAVPVTPQIALAFFVVIGSLRLTMGLGLALAFVSFFRHARYGGPVRPAEWLALCLASFCLVDAVANLDEAVNAYYAAVGSSTLNFGVARWLMSAPAAAGIVLIVALLILLRRSTRDGSRMASALTVVGIGSGLFLWFWGPCEVSRLELPWVLVPGPPGNWWLSGWQNYAVLALRDLVANSLMGLTWCVLFAITVRSWLYKGRGSESPVLTWTDPVAFFDTFALVMLPMSYLIGPTDGVQRLPGMVVVGLVSWWISGLVVAGSPAVRARAQSSAS